MELEEGWLGTPVGDVGASAVLVKGVEIVGVAEVVGLLLALDEVLAILDGTFGCPLKELQLVLKLLKYLQIPSKHP